MAPLPSIGEYYHIAYTAEDQSGSGFEFGIDLRRSDYYAGDGTDLGNGSRPGIEQLTAVAEGIAAGIQQASAPYWNNVSVASIDATPAGPNRLYPPTSEE